MRTKLISRILPYLLVFGFFLLDLLSFYNSSVYFPSLSVLNLLLFGVAAGWLIWRGFFAKVGLPKTGLETGVLAFGSAFLLNLLFTPEPRLAWPVLASILRFVFLLYFLLDVFDQFPPGSHIFTALLFVGLFFQVLVALEIIAAYTGWWNAAGINWLPPYPYRYIGLLFSSNGMMGYLNLFAPLAVMGLIRPWNRSARFLCAVWLVLFVACLPFSSSRAGWLGTAAGAGVLLLYFIYQKGWLRKFFQAKMRSRLMITVGILALVMLLAAGGLLFLKTFASHPSHGNNIYGGRSQIWVTVLQSFIDSPLVGAGAGRLGLEYLANAESIPPQFWAFHAHSMYIQVLAEFGMIGFAAFLFLLFLIVRLFISSLKRASEKQKLLVIAVAAGIFAWLVQSVFDTITSSEVTMDSLLFLTAAVYVSSSPIKRFTHIRFSIGLLPLALFFTWFLVNGWYTQPISEAIEPLRQGDLSTTEVWLSEAAHRDPDLRYNHDAYALVLSWQAELQNDTAKLAAAIDELDYVLETPSAPALWTANLAVMEWSSGDHTSAVEYMRKAVDQAPLEPTFYLNLGSMLDEMGDFPQAYAAFCQALQLQPNWQEHPFWNITQTRRRAAAECPLPSQDSVTYWQQAQLAIQAGNLEQAKTLLAVSRWIAEDKLAVQITMGLLFESQGRQEQAILEWEKALDSMAEPFLRNSHNFMSNYSYSFKRLKLPFELVPGYINLQQDAGQFDVIDKLTTYYVDTGDTARQAWLETIRQAAVNGQVGIYQQLE